MKVYLDLVIIENFLIDCVLLKEIALISKSKIKNKNIIFASLISSFYIALMLVFQIQILNYFICKLLLMFVSVYVAVRPKSLSEYIKYVTIYFLVNALNVGTIIVFKMIFNLNTYIYFIKVMAYIVGFVVGKLFITKFWKIYKTNIKEDALIYDVKVKLDKKTYTYKGFLDTGNTVYSDFAGVPIVFAEYIDKDLKERIKTYERFKVRTATLSSVTEKEAYLFENVEVKNKNEAYRCKVGIVFQENKLSINGEYNMILNYLLYEECLGGIKI